MKHRFNARAVSVEHYRWRRPARVMAAAVLLMMPARVAGDDADTLELTKLRQRVAELAADARVAPARVGVLVAQARTGRVLVNLREAEQFNIASNVKLITAAAVLSRLGPGHRFKTLIFAPRRKGAVVEGDLYLKGYGDPSLQVTDLWRMVQEIHARGVREVKGGVVVDETYFDRRRNPPLFATRKTTKYYRTTNGPLALRYNKMSVQVYGGFVPGAPGLVQVSPSSSYFKIVNKTVTTRRGRRWSKLVSTSRDTFEVHGKARVLRRGTRVTRRIEDPGLVTGHALLDLLRQRGIRVQQSTVRSGRLKRWTPPLVKHYSRPLSALLRHMNKRSDNFVAEQLLKVLGAVSSRPPGTWPRGLTAVSTYLAGVGIKPGSYVLKNGSGLYDASRFSPAQVVTVLRAASQDFSIGADYVASLAVAGVDGTMDYRCKKGLARQHVRAKTGTLANVVALSGYAGSSTGAEPLAFAIFFNDLPPKKIRSARKVADEMAEAMVTYLERGKRGGKRGKGDAPPAKGAPSKP